MSARKLPLSLGTLCFAAVAIVFIKIAVVTVYRLTWHPLAKYPGPFFAKISDWYAAYHAFKGDLHISMLRAHERYGDIVRFGPNRLLFNTVTGLQEIYHSTNVKKSRAYLALLSGPGAWNVHNAIDKTVNQRKRKIIRQGLSEEILGRFEPTLLSKANIFVQNMLIGSKTNSDGWTQPTNIADYCRFLIFDIMSEYCFGRSFDLQIHPRNRYMVDVMSTLHKYNSAYVQSVDLRRYHLDKIFYPQGLWYGWSFLTLAREFAESRAQCSKDSKQDLFSFISDAKDTETGQGFSLTELWSECKFLMVTDAGSPASALASLVFYLTRYPTCHKRLVAEVRATFLQASDIHWGPAMSSCRYLHACVAEALRMSPPTGGALWREIEKGGIYIEGHFIPAGYDIGTGIYAIHHNEAYFPEAFTFKPERWLHGEAESSIELAHSALTAFSMGPRGCLGRQLAGMELSDTIALLLWHLDFRRPSGPEGEVGGVIEELNGKHHVDEFQQEDHIVSFFDGPCVEFRRRKA